MFSIEDGITARDPSIRGALFDTAIDQFRKAIDSGMQHVFYVDTNLAAAYALAVKMDEAKTALADGLRKAGAAGVMSESVAAGGA